MVSRSLLACLTAALSAAALTALGCSRHGAAETSAPQAAQSAAPKAVPVTLAAVETRPIQRRVQIVGNLLGREEVTLMPKVGGRIVRIHHDVGDQVSAGEPLLELDATDYRLAVEEAERALGSELAKLGLTALPAGEFNSQQLPSVVRAHLLLENAQRKLKRLEDLRKGNQGFVTAEEFDLSRTDASVAQAAFRQAVMDVESTLALARQKAATLETMRQRLADAKLIVPPQSFAAPGEQTNYVVAERSVSEGEMVQLPASAAFRLVIDNPLKLVATVPERHSGEVRVGQAAEISVEAFPGRVFSGKISRLNPTIDQDNRTFQVEVLVPNDEHLLRPGSFAKGSVVTREDSEGLVVPLESLVTFAGVNKVFVVRDGKAHGVEVKLAERGPGWLEVLGDLHHGDQVATSGYTQLADGTPVRIRTPESTAAPTMPVAKAPSPAAEQAERTKR